MDSTELVLGPMVQMMEVRRYSLAGAREVSSSASQAMRPLVASRLLGLPEASGAELGTPQEYLLDIEYVF